MPAGGTKNYNKARELARNPNASTHRASATRTYVMKQLGVQTPGFWADWAKRKINPKRQQAAQVYTPSPSYKPLTNMYESQTWKPPVNKATKPLDTSAGWRLPSSPQGGGGGATGITKRQLQQLEKQGTWGQVKGHIASNPYFTSSVLDTISSEKINMGRQMMLYMNANPSAMLTSAAKNYFDRHPPYSAINTAQTNFEKQVGLYSETQKMAKKQLDYAAVESNKKVNELVKQTKTKGSYSPPSYKGGTMLNIGKGNGYNPVPYLSAFG